MEELVPVIVLPPNNLGLTLRAVHQVEGNGAVEVVWNMISTRLPIENVSLHHTSVHVVHVNALSHGTAEAFDDWNELRLGNNHISFEKISQ